MVIKWLVVSQGLAVNYGIYAPYEQWQQWKQVLCIFSQMVNLHEPTYLFQKALEKQPIVPKKTQFDIHCIKNLI